MALSMQGGKDEHVHNDDWKSQREKTTQVTASFAKITLVHELIS
jgi:hypothetical protein